MWRRSEKEVIAFFSRISALIEKRAVLGSLHIHSVRASFYVVILNFKRPTLAIFQWMILLTPYAKKVLFVVLCYCVQWHWHDLSPVKWQSYLRDLVVGLIWTCFNTIHMIILGKQYLQWLNNAIWFFCQKDITEVYVGLCVYNCYPTWLTILFKLFSWVQCNLVF